VRKILNLAGTGVLALLLIFQGAMMERYGHFRGSAPHETIVRYYQMMYANPGLFSLTWLGIPIVQNPNDAWMTQEIISETKPDFIIETGTAHGGSAVVWAMIQREVNPDGRVITIDIKDMKAGQPIPQGLLSRIDFVIGSSTDPEIVEAITSRVAGKRVMIILDSLHTMAHVARELELYSPMVSAGGYLIVQDTAFNGHPVFSGLQLGPGPWEAVEEFLASHQQFQADGSRERLVFTMHPNGYLRRIK
jgi:cephalosporin hydroxylase